MRKGSDAFVCGVRPVAVSRSHSGGAGGASGHPAGTTGGSVGAWDLRVAPSPRPARARDSPPSPAGVPGPAGAAGPSAGSEMETLGGSHGVTPGSPQAEPV